MKRNKKNNRPQSRSEKAGKKEELRMPAAFKALTEAAGEKTAGAFRHLKQAAPAAARRLRNNLKRKRGSADMQPARVVLNPAGPEMQAARTAPLPAGGPDTRTVMATPAAAGKADTRTSLKSLFRTGQGGLKEQLFLLKTKDGRKHVLEGGGRAVSGLAAAVAFALIFCAAAGSALTGFDSGLAGFPARLEAEQLRLAAEKEAKESRFAICINGVDAVCLASREEAGQVMEAVKAFYAAPSGQGSVLKDRQIEEEVTIRKTTSGAAVATGEAVALLLTGSREPRTHIVQGGDTLWDIAMANGISPYELMAMNPATENGTKLSVGQEINLYQIRPFLNVKTTEVVTASETIDYAIQQENDGGMYQGQTRVKVPGVPGSKTVVKEVFRRNGVIVGETVLSEEVTAEPSPQILLVGSKTAPAAASAAKAPVKNIPAGTIAANAGTGKLGSPLAYIEVSSPFGSRGGGRHLGTDMRIPKGSPIFAADSGTVTTASYRGTFGNLIVINHGNGMETYYAHCDGFSVSAGDAVTKGQTIGTVGKTGNATGYILHFEVRINGVAQNPMGYL